MTEMWRLGGSYVTVDGEKLLELRGIRMVNKRPTRATVHYRLTELEEFIYNFLKNRQQRFKGTFDISSSHFTFSGPIEELEQIKNGNAKAEELAEKTLRDNVDKTIKFLKDRIDRGFSFLADDRSMILAVSLIISSAFGFDIFPTDTFYDQNGATVKFLIPTFGQNEPFTPASTDISLPTDILTSEISSKMLSPRSSAMMNMTSKSIHYKKYEYENIIKFMPLQAFLTLSKLYSQEKDVQYKEYLFSLVMRAYSGLPRDVFPSSWDINDVDILATVFAFNLQIIPNNMFVYTINNYIDQKIDVIKLFLDLGVIDWRFVNMSSDSRNLFSIPDDFIEFVDKWREEYKARIDRMQAIPGFQLVHGMDILPEVRLTNDLKAGYFTRLYNHSVMVEAIKKGYIRRVNPDISLDAYYNLLTNLRDCSSEDKALIRQFIPPNPITEFFLGGIKPSVESMVRFTAGKVIKPYPISYCISYGMEFSDEKIDYLQLLDETSPGETFILIDITDKNILILKELGNNRFLAIATLNEKTRPLVLRKLDTESNLSVEDLMVPMQRLYIEYMVNVSDEDMNKIVEFFGKDGEDNLDPAQIYVDSSINDLSLYMRYMINQDTIRKLVEDSQIEYAREASSEEEQVEVKQE